MAPRLPPLHFSPNWSPQNAWVVNPTVLSHSPTPGSWLSPQQQTPGRPGEVTRTAGPILALRPGAHRVPNSCHLAQGMCICPGTFAPVLTGAALALAEAGPSHADQGRPQGPGGKFPTDPVPLRRAPPGAGVSLVVMGLKGLASGLCAVHFLPRRAGCNPVGGPEAAPGHRPRPHQAASGADPGRGD